MPKISIIVPVYNVEAYIHRCIDSILTQTFTNFELILIDDGSPDNCGEICDNYAKKDRRIKVIHKNNGGLSDARNAGLDIAKGEYIGFVDSDDFIESDMYEKLYKACIVNDVCLSMCARYDIYSDKKKSLFVLDEEEVWTSDVAIGNLLIWNNIDSSACDKLFKKKLFDNLRFPTGSYNEDIYIIPKIIHYSRKIVHIGEPKYNYYHRPESITTEIYTDKKLDLLEASEVLKEFIYKYYPNHKIRVDSFYYRNLIFLNSIIQSKEVKKKNYRSYKILYELLSRNIIKILFNSHVDEISKVKSILILLKVYSLTEKLVMKVRGERLLSK